MKNAIREIKDKFLCQFILFCKNHNFSSISHIKNMKKNF